MVKLEGAGHKLDVIRFLVERDIPVCAHLGLTPQSVLRFGGYKVQGRDEAAAAQTARRCARGGRCRRRAAGAGMRAVVAGARRSPRQVAIPDHRHRRRPDCDGQVLVLHDFLGLDSRPSRPKFVKDFLADGGSIAGAVRAYAAAVRDGSFPDAEHSY